MWGLIISRQIQRVHISDVVDRRYKEISVWIGTWVILQSIIKTLWISQSRCNDLPSKIKVRSVSWLFTKGWACIKKFHPIKSHNIQQSCLLLSTQWENTNRTDLSYTGAVIITQTITPKVTGRHSSQFVCCIESIGQTWRCPSTLNAEYHSSSGLISY